MFSSIKFYKLGKDVSINEKNLTDGLSSLLFKSIERTQESTQGFVDPCTQYAKNPVYGMSGAFLICLRQDSKSIPSSAVKRKSGYKIRELEKVKGEKPSKEEKDDIVSQVRSEMISSFPLDFVKSKFISAIIYPKEGLIAINTATASDCDLMLAMLRTSLGALPVIDYEADSMPTMVMTEWLKDIESVPEELTILQECQMKEDGGDGTGVVHCKNVDLESEEVVSHLEAGKSVVMIALEWNDSLLFKLKSDLTFSALKYSDFLKDKLKEDIGDGKNNQKFDAEVALIVDNLRLLAPNILQIFS